MLGGSRQVLRLLTSPSPTSLHAGSHGAPSTRAAAVNKAKMTLDCMELTSLEKHAHQIIPSLNRWVWSVKC